MLYLAPARVYAGTGSNLSENHIQLPSYIQSWVQGLIGKQ